MLFYYMIHVKGFHTLISWSVIKLAKVWRIWVLRQWGVDPSPPPLPGVPLAPLFLCSNGHFSQVWTLYMSPFLLFVIIAHATANLSLRTGKRNYLSIKTFFQLIYLQKLGTGDLLSQSKNPWTVRIQYVLYLC